MNQIEGCKIERLDEQQCLAVLGWVTGGDRPGDKKEGFPWLLAHCDDGVTWGRHDTDKQVWTLSSSVFPNLCPIISESNLIELRLFGAGSEILVWRDGRRLAGRHLIDQPVNEKSSPTRPTEETLILLGDRLLSEPRNGFTLVGTASGREQAVPLSCREADFKCGSWPLRLKVRHYFEKDSDTGTVRVIASRLVSLEREASHVA